MADYVSNLAAANYGALNGSLSGGISSLTTGAAAAQSATLQKETSEFAALLDSLNAVQTAKAAKSDVAPVTEGGRLNGDYTSGFAGVFTTEADKSAAPTGAAANAGMSTGKKIDKTSRLYQQAMELENYFVKIMLSSMRSTIGSSSLTGEKSYATKMYEDMMYDELSQTLTKNAGFGLADQIYLQLM